MAKLKLLKPNENLMMQNKKRCVPHSTINYRNSNHNASAFTFLFPLTMLCWMQDTLVTACGCFALQVASPKTGRSSDSTCPARACCRPRPRPRRCHRRRRVRPPRATRSPPPTSNSDVPGPFGSSPRSYDVSLRELRSLTNEHFHIEMPMLFENVV